MLYNSEKPDQFVYAKNNGDPWRTTGKGVNQNIYSYFNNTDENKDREVRWKIVQNEMNKENIKEIIVKVCSINTNTSSNTPSSKAKTPPLSPEINTNISEKIEDKNIIFVIPCSNEKNPGGNIPSSIVDLTFDNLLRPCREILMDLYIEAGNPELDWNKCLPAIERYNGIIYSTEVKRKIRLNPDKVVIVSALFGIIRPNDLIPDYDLSMESTLGNYRVYDFWKKENQKCIKCILNDVLLFVKNEGTDVGFIHLLSQNYQNAFCGFTNGIHPPALNYIPGLVYPPHPKYITDIRGHWKKNVLTDYL